MEEIYFWRSMTKEIIDKPAVVYWIHYSNHNNPYLEGYVGISTQLQKRIKAHSKSKHIGNKLQNGATITILHECISLHEAALIEKNYRPDENIGWNICEGGGFPPSREGKVPLNNKLIGDNRTVAQKEASLKHSEYMKGKSPWNKNKKGLQQAWNKGISNPLMIEIANTIHICPYCGKSGKGSSMLRWHFNNCKHMKNG